MKTDRTRRSARAADRFILALLLAGALVPVWPASSLAYRQRVLLEVTEADCTVRVEADEQARALRLRVVPEAPACVLASSTMQIVLKAALTQATRDRPEERYTSLFLGRLVAYPWLARQLAAFACHDPRWNKKQGRPVFGHDNSYVREVLSRAEIVASFNQALEENDYRVVAVEVEKVLVGRWSTLPRSDMIGKCSGRIPFDAMVWLVLGTGGAGGNGDGRSGDEKLRRD